MVAFVGKVYPDLVILFLPLPGNFKGHVQVKRAAHKNGSPSTLLALLVGLLGCQMADGLLDGFNLVSQFSFLFGVVCKLPEALDLEGTLRR